ncbi:hypothetical protein AQUCO_00900569v1 [Aquilegia coerulea]|uniref:Uncharacterized protein n=1 Tax=Aquilegia coerulea TaxID=218851 RepID=A0A2G5EEA0_AQUCA|nr:hypothetical protein AQUCO_00900569v1 [Aquilegia coerulea]
MVNRIRFWEDLWCGERRSKDEFPGIFARGRDENGTVEGDWQCLQNIIFIFKFYMYFTFIDKKFCTSSFQTFSNYSIALVISQRQKGVADPLEDVAAEISDESILLCLDEFMMCGS